MCTEKPLVTLSMSEAGADVMNTFKQQQHAPPLSLSTRSKSKCQSGLQKSGCDAKEIETWDMTLKVFHKNSLVGTTATKAAVVSADQGPAHPHESLTHHFFHLVINISTINFILVWERGEQLVCGWFWSSPALSYSPPGDRITLCIICLYPDHSDAHPFS